MHHPTTHTDLPAKEPTMDYPVTRTSHTARCLAKALVAAVENMRDSDEGSDAWFRTQAERNTMLVWADEYLASGLTECICP